MGASIRAYLEHLYPNPCVVSILERLRAWVRAWCDKTLRLVFPHFPTSILTIDRRGRFRAVIAAGEGAQVDVLSGRNDERRRVGAPLRGGHRAHEGVQLARRRGPPGGVLGLRLGLGWVESSHEHRVNQKVIGVFVARMDTSYFWPGASGRGRGSRWEGLCGAPVRLPARRV